MNLEKLTKDDWEWLAGKADVRQTFGAETPEELSQETYGGKFVHSPSMVESKDQNGRTGYILFRDIPDEPLVVWRD